MATRFLLLALFTLPLTLSLIPPESSPSPSPDSPADSLPSPATSTPTPSPSPAISSPSLPPTSNSPISSPPAPPPSDLASPPAATPSPEVPSPSPSELLSDVNHSNNVEAGTAGEENGSSGMNGGKKAGITFGVIGAAAVVGVGALVYKKRQDNIRRSQYSYAARRELL